MGIVCVAFACCCDLVDVVAGDVPLVGVLDGEVGAAEVGLAVLVGLRPRVGVQVLVKNLPHLVGQAQDLEVLGVPIKKV